MIRMPVYNSGIIDVFNQEDDNGIYPKTILKPVQMGIWFRELSVFDSMKMEYKKNSVNVTKKIAIPQYREIDSRHIVRIENDFYTVFNVVHVTNKDGIKESELTLIKDEGTYQRFIDSII